VATGYRHPKRFFFSHTFSSVWKPYRPENGNLIALTVEGLEQQSRNQNNTGKRGETTD
jgi:hypothetical protein